MKENVLERNARMDTDRKIADFRVKQQMDYAFKARSRETQTERCGQRKRRELGAVCAALAYTWRNVRIGSTGSGSGTRKNGKCG